MFSNIIFGDEASVISTMNIGHTLCEVDNVKMALSIANSQIKGILVYNCIPYDYSCKNKIHIDNIANLYAIANLYLASESVTDQENNKYALFKAQADDLLDKFLNNFRDSCLVENKANTFRYLGGKKENNCCNSKRYIDSVWRI